MTPDEVIENIRREWSLDDAGQREFKTLCRNVQLLRKRR
jgi:hypothetical protein